MKFELTPYMAMQLRDRTSDYRREAERAAIYLRARKYRDGSVIYYSQNAPPHYAFAAQSICYGGSEHFIMFTA